MDRTPESPTAAFARAGIVGIIRAADAGLALGRTADQCVRPVIAVATLIDAETALHVHRVAGYACGLAGACGWSASSLRHLGVAALLHDVGKIAVPSRLLSKAGPLTALERATVRHHTILARTLLGACRAPELRMAREVATHHHERWDGRGYPHGLAGTSIPLAARVVALADVFDALTSDRPYRSALSVETALGMIAEGAGTQFDPALAAAFLNLHDETRRCA